MSTIIYIDEASARALWSHLSNGQQCALYWSSYPEADHPGDRRAGPCWPSHPRILRRTWTSLVRKGLITLDERTGEYRIVEAARIVLPEKYR